MYLDLALRIFEIDTLFNFLFSPFIAVRGVLSVGFIHRFGIHDMRDNTPTMTQARQ